MAKKVLWSSVLALGVALVAGVAEAAGVAAVDVTDVVSGITNQSTSIATIGTTILGIIVGIVAFKWVRRVLK